MNLNLTGIDPDVLYSFIDNSFMVGDIESYNEGYISVKIPNEVRGAVLWKLNGLRTERPQGVANSLLEII